MKDVIPLLQCAEDILHKHFLGAYAFMSRELLQAMPSRVNHMAKFFFASNLDTHWLANCFVWKMEIFSSQVNCDCGG